jgi:hypothetical protein
MASRGEYAVKVNGLAELRRDLRRLEPTTAKEIQRVLKEGAEIVAREAALLAPRRTGALAESYKAYTRGARAGVRSSLPYAAVHEYGGTIRPRGTPILIQRSEPITRAVERQANAIVDELAAGIEAATSRDGW